jgi:hypothetical protein
MWEEVEAGRAKKELAREISKHPNHVRWMVRCWELVGKDIPGYPNGALPPFNDVYKSTEVRGDSGQDPDREDGRTRAARAARPARDFSQGTPSGDQKEDKSWAAVIIEATDMLERVPGFWDMLSTEELNGLRRAYIGIGKVLAVRGR